MMPSYKERKQIIVDWMTIAPKAFNLAMEDLCYMEREICKLRCGLSDGYCFTLEEVGQVLKITRERVRQVEAKSFPKLAELMRKYLDKAGALSD